MIQWHNGTMIQWYNDAMMQWYNDTMTHCIYFSSNNNDQVDVNIQFYSYINYVNG